MRALLLLLAGLLTTLALAACGGDDGASDRLPGRLGAVGAAKLSIGSRSFPGPEIKPGQLDCGPTIQPIDDAAYWVVVERGEAVRKKGKTTPAGSGGRVRREAKDR